MLSTLPAFESVVQRCQAKIAVLVGILDAGFLAAAILVSRLAFQGEARIYAIGFLGALLNIIMYGSPLAAMVRIEACSSCCSFLLYLKKRSKWPIKFRSLPICRNKKTTREENNYSFCSSPYVQGPLNRLLIWGNSDWSLDLFIIKISWLEDT